MALRNSGTSIAFNISFAVFGGTAPLLALFLIKATDWVAVPAVYLTLMALVVVLYLRLSKFKHALS